MPRADERAASTSLTADPENAAFARHFVGRVLQQWHLEPMVDVAALLTSELVSNAILHGHSGMELCVSRPADDRVRVEVTDHGAGCPKRRRASTEATTGRGLDMVHTLATDWGVRRVAGGKAVWFDLAPGSG